MTNALIEYMLERTITDSENMEMAKMERIWFTVEGGLKAIKWETHHYTKGTKESGVASSLSSLHGELRKFFIQQRAPSRTCVWRMEPRMFTKEDQDTIDQLRLMEAL